MAETPTLQSPSAASRVANILYLMPPDAPRLAKLALPLAVADHDGEGLAALVLTDDAETAAGVARAAARELGGGSAPVVAVTSAARARRVFKAKVPTVVAMPIDVAHALVTQSSLPMTGLRHVIVARPSMPRPAAASDLLDAVMAELPKSASRTLVTARETPDVEALVERHFFKARRVRDVAESPATVRGPIQVIGCSHGGRWEMLRRLIDQLDPPAAVVLTPDASSQAEAEQALRELGYGDDGVVTVSRDSVADGTSLVALFGVPEPALLNAALGASPANLVVLCAAHDLPEVRAIAGESPVRAVTLDTARGRSLGSQADTRARLREILASGGYGAELALVSPLLDEFDGIEIAAAALVMMAEAARRPLAITAIAAATPPAPRERPPRSDDTRSAGPRDSATRRPYGDGPPARKPRPTGDRPSWNRDKGGDRDRPAGPRFGADRGAPPRSADRRGSETRGNDSRGRDDRGRSDRGRDDRGRSDRGRDDRGKRDFRK